MTIIFIAFAWKAKPFAYADFLHRLLLHNFSGILGNLEQKNFPDHQTANTTELFAKKEIFLVYSFSEKVTAKGIP